MFYVRFVTRFDRADSTNVKNCKQKNYNNGIIFIRKKRQTFWNGKHNNYDRILLNPRMTIRVPQLSLNTISNKNIWRRVQSIYLRIVEWNCKPKKEAKKKGEYTVYGL